MVYNFANVTGTGDATVLTLYVYRICLLFSSTMEWLVYETMSLTLSYLTCLCLRERQDALGHYHFMPCADPLQQVGKANFHMMGLSELVRSMYLMERMTRSY